MLYILQGFIQGFTTSIPLYLASYKASWQQQGTFSWVSYPFSFKVVWAPIIDSFQSRRFGRYQTWLIPIQYGITRDTLALMHIPLLIIHILLPLCLNETRCPLLWFARGYIPRLIGSSILAIYIFFVSNILDKSYFYPVLIFLLCLNETLVYLMTVSSIGFYARISEPRIAGTYMTLLATISNLGHSLSSTLVLYIANWLPKSYAYSIEVGTCILLGFIWIGLTWRIIKRLDALPVEEWYLKPSLLVINHSISEEI
ncbi:unnamed protein product [Rotaria sordida]|uniref:Uncharacterized protein n=1 Tax=Rotaria sordida TaxID=392033 RepID=A0A814IKR9_9BILA|nr:unnamed protein product [Rotaria sordida]CAF3975672.1 unnamed protein product [Rotaria sordida]